MALYVSKGVDCNKEAHANRLAIVRAPLVFVTEDVFGGGFRKVIEKIGTGNPMPIAISDVVL